VPHVAPGIAVAAAVVCSATAARADDEWLARDKALHLGVSATLAGGGYAASSPWLDARWQRCTAGASLALGAGIAKEAWDATGAGDPSWKDFGADVAGTALGVLVALAIDHLIVR